MNIIKIDKDNMVNGPGIRLVVWFSGCKHNCKGCHNPDTWEFGENNYKNKIEEVRAELVKPYYSGLTLTGGCPLCQNLDDLIFFLDAVKIDGKDTWCWCGETEEELNNILNKHPELKEYLDVCVTEPYIDEFKCTHKYYGSENQKIIKIK